MTNKKIGEVANLVSKLTAKANTPIDAFVNDKTKDEVILIDDNYPGVAYVCATGIAEEVKTFMAEEGAAVHYFSRIPAKWKVRKVKGVSMMPDNWGLIIEE